MNETLRLVPACAAGWLLGVVFFGGLWWTVRKGVSSQQPALWLFSSLLVRMSVVLTGFYFVAATHWDRLLVCLFGFLAARFSISWLTRPREDALARFVPEGGNAP